MAHQVSDKSDGVTIVKALVERGAASEAVKASFGYEDFLGLGGKSICGFISFSFPLSDLYRFILFRSISFPSPAASAASACRSYASG